MEFLLFFVGLVGLILAMSGLTGFVLDMVAPLIWPKASALLKNIKKEIRDGKAKISYQTYLRESRVAIRCPSGTF